MIYAPCIIRSKPSISSEAQALFDARWAAKLAKDYEKADAIRRQLIKEFGVSIQDTATGSVVL
mgnify:CR=1 FL=1